MKLANLFIKPKIQKAVTIVKVISSIEYLVADAVNRRSLVHSDKKYSKGDKVLIQGSWVLGRGRVTSVIQNFEV